MSNQNQYVGARRILLSIKGYATEANAAKKLSDATKDIAGNGMVGWVVVQEGKFYPVCMVRGDAEQYAGTLAHRGIYVFN